MRLSELPLYPLGARPTPLQAAPRLSDELGIPVLVKRDDLTGLGVGGNKVRKLEYLVADALQQDADVLVTGGGRHSNHAALTALAAARVGLSAHLVFYGEARVEGRPEGNEILTQLVGARITYTGSDDRSSVDAGLNDVAADLRRHGRRPYVIGRGGASPLGCVGYVAASLELAAQLAEMRLSPSHVFVATGSCGTQTGLLVGADWLQATYEVVGITVSRPQKECTERITELASGCRDLLGLTGRDAGSPRVVGDYIGPGYGKPTAGGLAAIETAARTEGLLLDPVFTAKAMAALIDFARSEDSTQPVIFWHTGGVANLFAPSLNVGSADDL